MKEYAYLGNSTGVMRINSIGSIIFNTNDVGMTNFLMNDNEKTYEQDVSFMIENLVSANTTFIDIGANVGIHTIKAARVMGRIGRIIAFEPNPLVYENLKKNIQINGMQLVTKSYRIALFNAKGKASFSYDENNHRVGALHMDGYENYGMSKFEVKTDILDNYIDFTDNQRYVIKIDVEGRENFVLEGASKALKNIKDINIIFELNNHIENQETKKAIKNLQERNFFFYVYTHGSLSRKKADYFLSKSGHYNILATKSKYVF